LKTVQMTLDNDLVEEGDRTVELLGTTRSAFTRDALRAALDRAQEREMERRHREGYARHPVRSGELGDWESEQAL
jgi:metal-responsive CopG/Arc/MetJ family transcriptional regulator